MKKPIVHTYTVAEAVSQAFSLLEELGNEMREAFDNTPESLQSSAVGEARDEAASALESLSEPEVGDELGKREFTHQSIPLKAKASRSARRDDALELLRSAVSFLQEDDNNEEAELLAMEIEDLIDNAEAVEFPGMYGR